MTTQTAGDQINRALRLLGVLAEGETPSAQTSADALAAFNQMLDSWSTEPLAVFATDETVTWPTEVDLSTVLAVPPGYLRAIVYNLAMELAPEFGVEPSLQVQKIASTSKRDIRRVNNPGDLMEMPADLIRGAGYDINEG